MNTDRWHLHFLRLAAACAAMSKDPSTQVGAVIIGLDREVRSTGFNGLPRGIADTPARLQDREMKLRLVVHAEMNAALNAARHGVALKGCTLYIVAQEAAAQGRPPWGGPPCVRCSVEMIQAGITTVVSYPRRAVPSRWAADLDLAQALLEEAGVAYKEVGAEPAPKPCCCGHLYAGHTVASPHACSQDLCTCEAFVEEGKEE